MFKFLGVTLAAVACVLGSATAEATKLQVTVMEGGISGTSKIVASWVQDQNPTPVEFINDYYTTVPVFDAVGLGGDTAVTWYSGIEGQFGGFTNFHEDFNILAPVSYAFDEATPTFVPGTYRGVDIKPDYTYLDASYTITALPDLLFSPKLSRFGVFSLDQSVPEPASWAMMLIGLGVIGGAARRRTTVRKIAA